jgi:predicted nucleic acid-binding protein
MNFFDTNVLVAATIPTHVHHERSFSRLATLRKAGGSCSAPTLAETYNTLTRPTLYGIPAYAAVKILEEVAQAFTLISLTTKEILSTLEDASTKNLIGPLVFDALLMACARKAGATAIYTSNTRDFRKIAPDLAAIIQEP